MGVLYRNPQFGTEVFRSDFTDRIHATGRKITYERHAFMRENMPIRKAVIPLDQLVAFEIKDDEWPLEIKDQDGRGACNPHAAAHAVEGNRYFAGMQYVPLSPWMMYADLCRGNDQGSMISDALTQTLNVGLPPEALDTYLNIVPGRVPAAARAAAKRFRGEVGFMLTTWQQMLTAAALGRMFNFSIRVDSNFDQFDAEGVCGVARGVGNHAVCGGRGIRKLTKGSYAGQWAIVWDNSWTTRWGIDGHALAVEAHFKNQAYFEAYEIWGVFDDPEDPTKPPVLKPRSVLKMSDHPYQDVLVRNRQLLRAA